MRPVSFGFVAIFSVVSLAVFGCGSKSADPEYVKQVRAFAAAYHGYAESTRMTPKSLDDLKKDWGSFPLVCGDIQSGQFVVDWGVSLERSAAENDQYVLGYSPADPRARAAITGTHCQSVLFAGGGIRGVARDCDRAE
jgi:hypothetical protein